MTHILHLCADYSKQKLYRELFLELAQKGIRQTIYVPVRSAAEIGKYDIVDIPNITLIYAHILQKKHRFLYYTKIKAIYKDLVKKVDIEEIDLIHAHFLFSDGGVALKLKQNFGIPFVTAVRNTDINIFFKYMFHLRKFGQQIMSAANEVLFVTPTYRKLLAEQYLTAVLGKQILNATVIPNGLTSDWLSNAELRNKPHTPLKLLYVGDFTSNKNIIHLLQVVRKLSNEMAVTLTLVGGGGDGHMEVERTLQQQGFEFAQYLGKVEGINAIKTLYRKHDIFIMISKLETFGLVYLEALSQGLPIIHTAGQGIDGYFDNSSFAIPVKSNGMEEIITAIKKLAFSYETASRQAVEAAQPFSWEQIADRYTNLYFEKLNK